MRKITSVIILIIYLHISAARGQEIEYVASTLFSGTLKSCAILDDLAVGAGDHSLQIFSIYDPDNPILLSGRRFLSPVDQAFIQDQYVYVTGENENIHIIDISDSAHPADIGILTIDCPTWISFDGSLAHVTTCSSGVFIYNMANPIDPEFVGQYLDDLGGFNQIFLFDHFAFVSAHSELLIFDIEDWENPELMSSYVAPARIKEMIVEEENCFILWYDLDIGSGIQILEISDPGNPIFIAEIPSSVVYDFATGRDYLYAQGNELNIFDISDPSSPSLVAVFSIVDFTVTVDSDRAVIAGISFDILDISDPSNPVRRGNYHLPGWVQDVSVVGDFAYTANSIYDIYITDISAPENSIQVGRHERFGIYYDVYVVYPYAYFLSRPGQLRIFNISNPHEPVLLSEQNFNGDPRDIVVKGRYAYIAGGNGMYIMDISDPEDPILVNADYDNFTNCLEIDVVDDYAYVVDDRFTDGDLKVINVGDPENLFLENSVDYHATDIVIRNDYGFASGIEPAMVIIDISDRVDPVVIGTYNQLDTAEVVFVSDNLAYLIAGNSIELVDIGDPRNPVRVGQYDHLSDPSQFFVKENYIFIADRYSLEILRLVHTAVDDIITYPPFSFALSPAYPHPFNAATTIRYDLPKECDVRIEIYDLLGRKIETLVDGIQPAGSHAAVWEAEGISSGVYFYRIRAGEHAETKKALLLK